MENIGEDYLASTHIKTPDYRQENPPRGQRINVSWDFPFNLYEKNLFLCLTARLWNNTQEKRKYHLQKRWGTTTFFFENKTKEKGNKILTYKLEVITDYGKIIETWEHQFWTELIDVDEDDEIENH